MKKHILLLGIFLSLTVFLSVQAGNTVIDSLKQEIRQAEREPSSKEKLIELYQFLGAEYETLDHDSSYHYIQKGLSLYPQPAFEEEGYLLLAPHIDQPNMIGQISTILGQAHINITGMQLAKMTKEGTNIMAIAVQDDIPNDIMLKLRGIEGILDMKLIHVDTH